MNEETIDINEQLDILEETKAQIKQAIISKGQSVSDEDSFRSYANKIDNISTMNAQLKTVTPTTNQQVITPDTPEYNALASVTVNAVDNNIDDNIQSENIKSGITILGVTGKSSVVDTEDANALASDIVNPEYLVKGDGEFRPRTAYVNGQKISGTILEARNRGDNNIPNTPTISNVNTIAVTLNNIIVSSNLQGTYSYVVNNTSNINMYVNKGVFANAINLTANKIKQGENIIGVNGTVVELKGTTLEAIPQVNSQSITPQSPYNAFTVVNIPAVTSSIDSNIMANNIKNGVTILGITGNLSEGINTSDATATVEDIMEGKTAYVNGVKLVGTRENLSNVIAEQTNIINNLSNLVNSKAAGGGGSGEVKLYDSISNMNADHSVDDGQLAIVYHNQSANITADTEFQVGIFPETVVLPTAFTDYAELGFTPVEEGIWIECWGRLESNEYNIDMYGEIGEIRIRYESSDGITYTRTEFMKDGTSIEGDELDFGMLVKFGSMWGEATWNDAIGYFTQTGSVAFDGLYQYGDNSYSLAKTQFTSNSELVYNSLFYGKNGIESGSMQNVENLTINQMITKSIIYSDISNLYLDANITNLYNAFCDKRQLRTTPVIDTTNVTNMCNMFSACFNLVTISNINTINVTDMTTMFRVCTNLISVPNLDTSNVTNMSYMFYACNNLIDLPDFNTINVTNMDGMFSQCFSLVNAPSLNTSNVVNMCNMFSYCNNLSEVPVFNMQSVRDTFNMFSNCNNLSANAYANIANMLPLATQLYNRTLNYMSLNILNFTDEQKRILGNKQYLDAIPYIINTSNVSSYWNIYYE